MNTNETKRKATVDFGKKTATATWSKQLEDDLMKYHGLNAADEIKEAIKHQMKTELTRNEINAIVHPLLSDPMDMNGMEAATDKIMKVFEKYSKL